MARSSQCATVRVSATAAVTGCVIARANAKVVHTVKPGDGQCEGESKSEGKKHGQGVPESKGECNWEWDGECKGERE